MQRLDTPTLMEVEDSMEEALALEEASAEALEEVTDGVFMQQTCPGGHTGLTALMQHPMPSHSSPQNLMPKSRKNLRHNRLNLIAKMAVFW